MTIEGRVLVVDPEPLVVELIARTLREAGFAIEAAADSESAMRAAVRVEAPIDVVLVATQLPDCHGLDLVRRLRADPAAARASIALLTVLRDPEETFRVLDAGADDCLRKPLHRAELLARVRSLLRIKRQIDELHRAKERLEELNAELGRSATTDALTKLANRRAFEERLAEEVQRASRYGLALSLLVIDVDHFKKVNDGHGHAAGDHVLRSVAATLKNAVRRVDLVARYGGEEMIVLTPSTERGGAAKLAERLRVSIADTPIPVQGDQGATELRVTVSIGVAQLEPPEQAEDLFSRADAALYAAKRGGRNRVVEAPRAAEVDSVAAERPLRQSERA